MKSALAKYGYINAKLRARISKILSEDFLHRMVRSASLSEAVSLLMDTDFAPAAEAYNRTGDLKTAELELLKQEVSLLADVGAQVAGDVESFVSALALRYEVANLKNALRLWFDRVVRGRNIQAAVGYLYRRRIVHDLDLDAVVNADSLEVVVEVLQSTPYARVLAEQSERFHSMESVFPLEVALDHTYYGRLLAEIRELSPKDRKTAGRMIGVEIDIMNIHWMLRFKTYSGFGVAEALRYAIPHGYGIEENELRSAFESPVEAIDSLVKSRYGALRPLLSAEGSDSTSRMVMLEHILEEILLWEVRRILAGYPFTIGIILAYFVLKRAEIRRVMTILNAKYYALPEERIASVL